jgi:hypothetical protein
MVRSSVKSEFMSGTAFDEPRGFDEVPSSCKAGSGRLSLPVGKIKIATRLL